MKAFTPKVSLWRNRASGSHFAAHAILDFGTLCSDKHFQHFSCCLKPVASAITTF
jgi:hypothetical protein